MTEMEQTPATVLPQIGGEYWFVEVYDRDLECEHRDTLENGDLDPCELDAEYAVSTPALGEDATTRTRYCSIHIWDSIERWLERNPRDSNTETDAAGGGE